MSFLDDYATLLLGPAGVNADDAVEVWAADPSDPLVAAVSARAAERGLDCIPRRFGDGVQAAPAAIVLLSPETHPGRAGGNPPSPCVNQADGVWRWQHTTAPLPTAAWASELFPRQEDAAELLHDALGIALRFDREGGAEASWLRRFAQLDWRARKLNELAFDGLSFNGEGCELHVPLTEESFWIAPRQVAAGTGRPFTPNLPCEEVFTAPAVARLDGHVRCNLPRHLRTDGRPDVIEIGLQPGRAPSIAPAIADLAAPGCEKVGEIALVDDDTGVRRAGVDFGDVVTAENGACHLALGYSIPGTGGPTPEPHPSGTGPQHHDLPIAGTLTVTADTAEGPIAILDEGRWIL